MDRPMLLQPPKLENSVKTALGVRCGARHHRMTTMAQNESTCSTMSAFCMRGQKLWPQMLKV